MSSGPSNALLKHHLDVIKSALASEETTEEQISDVFDDPEENAPEELGGKARDVFFKAVGYIQGTADAVDLTVISLLDEEGLL